jgi:hypothetical protein
MKRRRFPLLVWVVFSLFALLLLGCGPGTTPEPTAAPPTAASATSVVESTAIPTATSSPTVAATVTAASPLPIALELGVTPAATAIATAPPCQVAIRAVPEIQALMNQVSRDNLLASVQALENFGTRHTLSPTDRPTFGIGAARTWIYNEFVRIGNGRLEVTIDEFLATVDGQTTSQQNIVAKLPGTGSHAGAIVLMAHYDSRTDYWADGSGLAPGANDNASGVSVLIEVARLLSTQTWNQTVMFVAMAAEEQNLQGSHHFVNEIIDGGLVVDAAINNDIVGGRPGIPQSIRLFSGGPVTSAHRQLARYVEFVGGLYLPDFDIVLQEAADREGRYSDHFAFAAAGIPAIRLIQADEDFTIQHNTRDTLDHMDFDYLQQVVQLNLVTVANLIGAPAGPSFPNVNPTDSPRAYQLSWHPHPLAVGYAISFRPQGAAGFAPFHTVCGIQVGHATLSGLDPDAIYAVSLAAVDADGRIGAFSPEIPVGPSR